MLFRSAQTISVEEYEPRSTLVVPQHPVARAKYPFIDVHGHPRGGAPQFLNRLLSEMDQINMRVMVNLDGRWGEALQKNVQAFKGRDANRFAVFANLNFSGINEPDFGKRAAAQLEQDVKNGAAGLKLYKNFGMDLDRKSTRLNSSHIQKSRMPSSA